MNSDQETKQTMQYTVKLQDIPETDQLVLRLIFSLSEKAAARQHSYRLHTHDEAAADITIQMSGNQSEVTTPAPVWFGGDTLPTGAGDYQIKKPLIATRVLSVLDRYIGELKTDDVPPEDTVTPAAAVVEPEAEIEFCISEEEASELAIVEDEALANPANSTEAQTGAPEITPEPSLRAQCSSLLMFQRNKALPVQAEPLASAPLPAPRKPHALVVDDSPSVRKQIELELNLFEVEVDFAEDAASALRMLQENAYELAFLDVVLPDGDGFQICKSIRQTSKDMKVVMLTGKATPADKVKGKMAGCDAYLVKPVGRMTFQNTVCNYLQLRDHAAVIQA